jgi:hypothetical protein
MKTLFKFIAVAIVLLGIETNSYAQLTITSSASGTILQTLEFQKNYDLDFGNMAVSAQIGDGTCTVPPVGGIPVAGRTVTGGVTLPALIGTPQAAEFIVTGYPNQVITIDIPTTDIIITHTVNPLSTMTVNTLTVDATVLGGGHWTAVLDGSGEVTFHVGGTCHVLGSQEAGLYTNLTAFPVTVNYQ